MPQLFFGSVAFFPQILFVQNPPNSYGKTSDAIHFDTIVDAILGEFDCGFSSQCVCYENERCSEFLLAQKLNRLRPLAVGVATFSYDKVVPLRGHAFGHFLDILSNMGSDYESHAVQLVQAALYSSCITMNEQNLHGLPTAGRFTSRSGTVLISSC
jgi:hypothetical protein